MRRCMPITRARVERETIGRTQSVGAAGNRTADNVSRTTLPDVLVNNNPIQQKCSCDPEEGHQAVQTESGLTTFPREGRQG